VLNGKETDVYNVQLGISIILVYANLLIINAENGVPKDALNAIKGIYKKMEFVYYQISILLLLLIMKIHCVKNGMEMFVRIAQIEHIVTMQMFALWLTAIVTLMIDLMGFA
jgi:hypothetical protein